MNTRIKKLTKNTLFIFIAFALLFSGIPFASGSAEADAATHYWKSCKARANSYTSTTISWKKLSKKQRKKISGIAVFRGTSSSNLTCVTYLNKSSTSFTDRVRAGTKYCYQLKTFKVKKVKQKQYFNKKTHKWQTKKIKKAKKRTVKKKKYKYSHSSSLMWLTTPKKSSPPKTTTQPAGTPASQTSATDTPAKPASVTGLKTTSVTTNSISIIWNKISGKHTGYEVFLNGTVYRTVGSGINSLDIKYLSKNTSYSIKVRSYLQISNKTSYSDFTLITVKTMDDPPAVTDATPGAVTGLKVVSTSGSTIKIAWDQLSDTVTGYEIRVDGAYYCEVGSDKNTLTIRNLNSETAYDITVTAYFTVTKTNYGTPAQITAITKEAGNTDGNDDPDEDDNPGGTNPPGEIPTYQFDYRNIPFAQGSAIIGTSSEQGSVDIGNGQRIDRGVHKALLPIVQDWMDDNLPADATDAEKANLCVKAVYELKNTPESIAIMGNPNGRYPDDPHGWIDNSQCIRYADYFDTCAYAAGLISASRLCDRDEDYGIPFLRNHVTNFVWIDGVGYVTELSRTRKSNPTLTLINFDWKELHIVPTNTNFECRYY